MSSPTLCRSRRQRLGHRVLFALVALSPAPALAQNLEGKIQNLGNMVTTLLSVAAVVVATAMFLVAAMKYMKGDQHAQVQVTGILIGSFLAFGAAGIVQALRNVLL